MYVCKVAASVRMALTGTAISPLSLNLRGFTVVVLAFSGNFLAHSLHDTCNKNLLLCTGVWKQVYNSDGKVTDIYFYRSVATCSHAQLRSLNQSSRCISIYTVHTVLQQ